MPGNKGKVGLTKLETVLAVLFVIALVAAGASWAMPRAAEVQTVTETIVNTVTKTIGPGEVVTETVTQTVEKTLTETVTVAAPTKPPERKIRLGLLTSLTGPAAPLGEDQRRAVEIAVDEINAMGGVFVREFNAFLQIEVFYGDDQTSREGAVSAARKLITQDQVDVIFGGLGSAFGMAALPVIQENKIPYVPTPSTPLFTRTEDLTMLDPEKYMVFHYQATGLMYGAAMADFVVEVIKPILAPDRPLRIAWLYQDSPFGSEYFRGYQLRVEEMNYPLELVYEDKFPVRATDFRAQLTEAFAANPDVLFPIGFLGETIPAVQQAVLEIGFDKSKTHIGPLCACADVVPFYKNLGREAGEYTTLLAPFSTYTQPVKGVTERVQEFRQKYQERYGALPGLLGASAYDAVYIIARAIYLAGTLDKAAIIEALEDVKMDQILLPVKGGKITFDEFNEVEFDLFVTQMFWDETLQELRPKVIWPSELAEAEYIHPS